MSTVALNGTFSSWEELSLRVSFEGCSFIYTVNWSRVKYIQYIPNVLKGQVILEMKNDTAGLKGGWAF